MLIFSHKKYSKILATFEKIIVAVGVAAFNTREEGESNKSQSLTIRVSSLMGNFPSNQYISKIDGYVIRQYKSLPSWKKHVEISTKRFYVEFSIKQCCRNVQLRDRHGRHSNAVADAILFEMEFFLL